jgi:hypothetical protein
MEPSVVALLISSLAIINMALTCFVLFCLVLSCFVSFRFVLSSGVEVSLKLLEREAQSLNAKVAQDTNTFLRGQTSLVGSNVSSHHPMLTTCITTRQFS